MVSVSSLSNSAKGMGIFSMFVAIVLAVLQMLQYGGSLSGTAQTSVGTFITAIGGYATWASILVIAIIGFFLLKFMSNK